MGYKKMTEEDVYQIFKRWYHGQKIKRIAKVEERDRKTVRTYIMLLKEKGFTRDVSFPAKEIIYRAIEKILPQNKRKSSATESLKPHEDEIKGLIHDKNEPVKPKTAYEIIKKKYSVTASYGTFKNFVRKRELAVKEKEQMIRIELPPGIETQLDYGKMGRLIDPFSEKNRDVYAFCAILSNSRLPFIQYVYKQNEKSFAESFIDTFEFYGGCTEFVSIDNLKAGVIKPDLYDPKLNKSLEEVAEYYGVFIDPCRVGKSTDKGKIERMVPVARELFRKLKKLYPTADIKRLNELALEWCTEEYGTKEHGTTGIPPIEAFNDNEKSRLKALPAERFVVGSWKKPTVHPDQFFMFDTMRFSLPYEYRKHEVNVRRADNLLQVYYNYRLIRQYIIFEKKRLYFVKEDFPEVVREMMDGSYPHYLLEQSRKYGNCAYLFVENILKPHAYLNTRRAQGVISLMEKHYFRPYFLVVCENALKRGVKLPKTFKSMLETAEKTFHEDYSITISVVGKEMVRNIEYYLK